MADSGIIARLAALLSGGNTFGGKTFGGATMGGGQYGGQTFGQSARPLAPPPQMARAAPPPLPQFQIPGLNTLGMDDPTKPPVQIQRGASTPVPAGAMPSPMPQQMPQQMPMGQPPAMPPQAQPGPLQPLPPPVNIGAAPGMGASPTTLDDWRKTLDAMQFSRQGQ